MELKNNTNTFIRCGFARTVLLGLMVYMCTFSTSYAADIKKRNQLFKEGMKYYESGDYDKAIKDYEKVVYIDPNFAPVYNALGLAYSQTDSRLSDVIWFYKVALDIDPKYAEAYHNMCRAYYDAGHFDKAEEACLNALSADPGYLRAKLSLAWIYLYGKESPHQAIYYFKEVLEYIKNPLVYYGLGMAYARIDDGAEVVEVVTTLRGMNENGLASSLENLIRRKYIPPPEEAGVAVEQNTISTVVKGPAPKPNKTEKPKAPSVSPGEMRIRLKGTMMNLPKPKPSNLKDHPGSL